MKEQQRCKTNVGTKVTKAFKDVVWMEVHSSHQNGVSSCCLCPRFYCKLHFCEQSFPIVISVSFIARLLAFYVLCKAPRMALL